MTMLVFPQLWRPAGVEELEPNAEVAVRATQNTLVVAGPGAGKTELLAQRADYLLRTGICRAPYRILAISFKRDAARNLADRVAKRLPAGLADRLDSWTFDSFSKQILDRFRPGLPAQWRPHSDYMIDLKIAEYRADFLIDAAAPVVGASPAQVAAISKVQWYRNHFIGRTPLPVDATTMDAALPGALARVAWQQLLHPAGGTTSLNFAMIARLAELLLRTNPAILKALRETYRYVFLDEFQDTTTLQYDLLTTAFHGTTSVLTAVGDPKQSIMVWAGALKGIMERFALEFTAHPLPLRRNYRSAPELVEILAHLARQIDPHVEEPESARTDGRTGHCRVFEFTSGAEESRALANFLKHAVEQEGLAPRDVCILCRKKVADYSQLLCQALDSLDAGFHVRDETRLQDLLSEPVVTLLADTVRLATAKQARDAWCRLTNITDELAPSTSDVDLQRRRRQLSAVLATLREQIGQCAPQPDQLKPILQPMITFIGEDALCNRFPQYSQGDWFAVQVDAFCQEVCEAYPDNPPDPLAGWRAAVDRFEGVDSVPVITIHKSKGLEYDTVIFLGLEDAAFNNMRNADEEGNNFFVAFSRAENRVVFTFSRQRFGTGQSKRNVQELYAWLAGAGVAVESVSATEFKQGLPNP